MKRKIITTLFALLMLTGCSAPTVAPMPTLAPFATTDFAETSAPTRVVTLVKNTPSPAPATPTLAVTLPSGAVLLTVSGDGFVNARSGPGALFDIVGRVASGAQLPAIAQSPGGEWILITSPEFESGQGWVYIHLTDFDPAQHPLPVVTPPATPVMASPTP